MRTKGEDHTANIGFIGTGILAEAMVRGLAGEGHEIFISKHNAAISAALADAFNEVQVMENQAVLDTADDVFLCLMADQVEEALGSLTFLPGQRIVSVTLGVDLAVLARLCAPAEEIAITIPLAFIRSGGCPLPVYQQSRMLDDLFGSRNDVILDAEGGLNQTLREQLRAAGMNDRLRDGLDSFRPRLNLLPKVW